MILDQLNERRPLPMGMKQFDDWAERIISGTLIDVPEEVLKEANENSLKFALSTMLLHLGPQESHKEDAYFIHSLRKSAVNQIAHAKMKELMDAAQAKADAEALKRSKEATEETLKRIDKGVEIPDKKRSKITMNQDKLDKVKEIFEKINNSAPERGANGEILANKEV